MTREGTTLTPYLTLPYILSLTWLAYPIISLLFVAFRLAISSSAAEDSVEDAKTNLLASCAAAEKAATAAASLPRYMAVGTNKQIAAAVNGTMNAARATLVLSLTIVEGIINFVIDIYRSTFLCFVELVVRGGLAARHTRARRAQKCGIPFRRGSKPRYNLRLRSKQTASCG